MELRSRELDDVGSSGTAGQVVRWPGPRQGTAVYAHTHVGMEQFCHELIPPFLQRCLRGSHLRGLNLNRFVGRGSRVP